MDASNPQISKIEQDFFNIDTDKDNLITEQEIKTYLIAQKVPFLPYMLKKLVMNCQDGKVNKKSFVSYVLACKNGVENLAIFKQNLEKNIEEHTDAHPPHINEEVKTSYLKFVMDGKQETAENAKENKQYLKLNIGVDKKKKQNQERQALKKILGRDPKVIYLVLKFKVKANAPEIGQAMELGLQQLKQLTKELDQTLGKILDMFQITVKSSDNYVFAIFQVENLFLQQLAQTFHELIISASPNCQLKLHAYIQSEMFSTILTKGLNDEAKSTRIQLGFDTDVTSLNKIRKIINKQTQSYYQATQQPKQETKLFLLISTLLQEVQLQTHFKNSSQFFSTLGMKENKFDIKDKLVILKQMQISEMIQGFTPQIYEFVMMLKEHGDSEVEVEMHMMDLAIKLQWNLVVEGFFDLFL